MFKHINIYETKIISYIVIWLIFMFSYNVNKVNCLFVINNETTDGFWFPERFEIDMCKIHLWPSSVWRSTFSYGQEVFFSSLSAM